MRWPMVMLVVGACGGGEGTLLVVEAPDGATAKRVEIMLASAEPKTIEDADQRVAPRLLEAELVRYYRQRAITGEVDNDDSGLLDGFAVRLEANPEISESALIPFLIGFDDRDRITAIGAVMDDDGLPSSVEIAEDRLLRFTVTMPAMAPAGNAGVGSNEVVRIDCSDKPSGIAWRFGGTQLRLLFPHPEDNDQADSNDALTRLLDLDCDGREAAGDDCDDLRPEFHVGAAELCDGFDYDCDGGSSELVTCNVASPCTPNTGIAVCDDRPDEPNLNVCSPSPECSCQLGACAECVIDFQAAGTLVEPCKSVATAVRLDGCGADTGGCSVEVLDRPGSPFRILLSHNGGLATKVDVVDEVSIHVQPLSDLTATGNDVVGGIVLLVKAADGTVSLLSFAIRLSEQPAPCDIASSPMSCTQP